MLKTVIITLFSALAAAQTSTQVGSQTAFANSVQDFSTAGTTRPMAKGNTLPATCALGDQFFKSNATAGQNLYGCTAVNTWTQQAGGGSSGGSNIQYDAAKTTATRLTLGGVNCTATTPCVTTQSNVPLLAVVAGMTGDLGGASAGGTAFIYVDKNGQRTLGHNSATTVTGSAGFGVVTGVTAFPAFSCPMWQITWTANVWDAINIQTMFKGNCYTLATRIAGTCLLAVVDPTTGIITDNVTCSGSVDIQNFPAGGGNPGGATQGLLFSNNAAFGGTAFTGPNAIAAQYSQLVLAVNDWVYAAKTAGPTWSGAAGTVDIAVSVYHIDGAPAAGNWNFNFYVGCAATGAVHTYGAATTVTSVPGSAGLATYAATGLALPAACAANKPMQFWLQRVADTGGATGVRMGVVGMLVTIRGN